MSKPNSHKIYGNNPDSKPGEKDFNREETLKAHEERGFNKESGDEDITGRSEKIPNHHPSIHLSKERRSDMLCGAIEGGSNYWYFIAEKSDNIIRKYLDQQHPYIDRMLAAIYAGETIEIHDAENEEEKLGEINLASMDSGEVKMFKDQPHHYADILGENDDAITADVWFQFCSLQELIYG